MTERIHASGRAVEIGNPDKVLFDGDGITKLDLARYYAKVADVMTPHVRGRPVTMERYPDGIGASGFFQKEAPRHLPKWVHTATVPKDDGEITHVLAEDAATLVFLADQACITPHVWLGTADRLDAPDRLVFDLDPPAETESTGPVREAARSVRELLDELGLRSRIMTTGSSGFHVVVPLDATESHDEVRNFARRCAQLLSERHPERLTVEQRIRDRGDRVFVDYLRNAYAQTTVAPYAVRALPGAPVATPIDWDELGSTEPKTYTIANVVRRLGQKRDPWADDRAAHSLADARSHLDELAE